MCPAANSSVSRTSTSTAPLEACSRACAGSTSPMRLLIWRRSSAPEVPISQTPQMHPAFNTSLSIARLDGLRAARPNLLLANIRLAPSRVHTPWKEANEMVALIVLLLLLLIFGGLGFAIHVLWFVLIGLVILWLIGWFVGAGSSAFARGRRRWYRW